MISEDDAISGLRYFKWNQERFSEKWFDNEDKLKRELGIEFDKRLLKTGGDIIKASLAQYNGDYCIVCYSSFKEAI